MTHFPVENINWLPFELCLFSSNHSERLSQQTYAYSPVEVGGWGETKQSGPVSTRLQAVTLNVITNEQCNDNYPYRITASQMCCLTPDRKDTCNVS